MSERNARRIADVEAIFQSAVELPAERRDQILADQCGSDAQLRAYVERLLSNHDTGMGEFLEPLSSISTTHELPNGQPMFAPCERVAKRYKVMRLLGCGGMGEVYEVLDEDLGVALALKTLPAHLARDPSSLKRLKQEVLLARSITHSNVCRVYDLGRHESSGGELIWFLTMELLAGESLTRRLAKHGPFKAAKALPLVEQIVAGLEAAHRVGVTHLDFKSGNIMLIGRPGSAPGSEQAGERVVVTDFGLARAAETSDEDIGRIIGGTPAYMAPEQVRGEATGPVSDVYALGVVLYEMVTGELPFSGWTSWRAAMLRLPEMPVSPRLIAPDLDDPWERVIFRCLSRDPRERFASAKDVADALRQSRDRSFGETVTSVPSTPGVARERIALPVEQDTFVGRKAELEELRMMLTSGSRLVTILGAAGMGKTRLAVRYGWQRLEDWPGGVWFCDLSDARSVNGIVSVVARSLGVQLGRGNPIEQLGHAIAGRDQCLIVFDNFEQIVEQASEILGKWLDRARQAHFVVTSRERLKLAMESVLKVEPLDMGSGIQLFEERVRRLRPDFEARGPELELAHEAVRLTDGMPMAIELVAARTWAMTVEQVVKRLRVRHHVREGEGEGGRGSLRVAIDGSWELLKPWEQAAWAQCSVFEGGFTLEAADAVVDMDSWPEAPWVVDVLRSLVDKSLLRLSVPDGSTIGGAPGARFGMYVSLQEYARRKLGEQGAIERDGSGEQAARLAKERHGRWFSTLGIDLAMDPLGRLGGVERRTKPMRELENLVAACQRAIARGDEETATLTHQAAWAVLELRGPFAVGVELGREIMRLPLGKKARVRVLTTLGMAEWHSGKIEDAWSRFEAAVEIYRELGREDLVGFIIGGFGNLDYERGRVDSALTHWEAALASHRACKARIHEGIALGNLGLLHRQQGRIEKARGYYEAALAIHREVGERRLEGLVLNSLGNMHREQGSMEEACSDYEAGLAIIREVGDRRSEGVLLGNLGSVWRDQGRMAEARPLFEAALVIQRETGDRRSQGIAIGNLALLEHEQGRIEEARFLYETALSIHREVGNRFYEGAALGNLGNLHQEQGRLDDARLHYEEALAIHRDMGNRSFQGIMLGSLGLLNHAQDREDEAEEAMTAGELILREVGDLNELGKLLCGRAEIKSARGDHAGAAVLFHEAQELAKRIGASSHSDLGRKLEKLGQLASSTS